MNAGRIKKVCGLGTFVTCLFVSASALAEEQQQRPLSMTYQLLGIKVENAKPAPTSVNRCAALTWVASIGACGRDLLAKIVQSAERAPRPQASEDEESTPAAGTSVSTERRVAADPAVLRPEVYATVELPTLGSSEPRAVRAGHGGEALLGSNRSADLLLRVGSKHRFSAHDESFTDANYQAHMQNNAHKALGVELLVPFQ